ncbi:MAG TPA: hypothetical protein VG096_07410 [Bryobacteraceae bacterium]|nr:hypothetical protein [Bryobacteraceae bacterium]
MILQRVFRVPRHDDLDFLRDTRLKAVVTMFNGGRTTTVSLRLRPGKSSLPRVGATVEFSPDCLHRLTRVVRAYWNPGVGTSYARTAFIESRACQAMGAKLNAAWTMTPKILIKSKICAIRPQYEQSFFQSMTSPKRNLAAIEAARYTSPTRFPGIPRSAVCARAATLPSPKH